MKKKEFAQLKDKSDKDLSKMVADLKKKIALDYMKVRVGQEKNLKVVKNARRDLAQVLTVMGQKAKEVKN